jgi:hypothetical protein
MPHTGAVEKIKPVLAALVMLRPKVKPVGAVSTRAEAESHEQEWRYGESGKLRGGEVGAPEDGGQYHGDLCEYHPLSLPSATALDCTVRVRRLPAV